MPFDDDYMNSFLDKQKKGIPVDDDYTNPFLDKFISQSCYNYMIAHAYCMYCMKQQSIILAISDDITMMVIF